MWLEKIREEDMLKMDYHGSPIVYAKKTVKNGETSFTICLASENLGEKTISALRSKLLNVDFKTFYIKNAEKYELTELTTFSDFGAPYFDVLQRGREYPFTGKLYKEWLKFMVSYFDGREDCQKDSCRNDMEAYFSSAKEKPLEFN